MRENITYITTGGAGAPLYPSTDLTDWQEHAEMVNYVLAQRFQEESLVAPPKLIDGHDLIDIFGISPGLKIGELLESVREAQATGEVTTRQEALACVREQLSSSERLSTEESG